MEQKYYVQHIGDYAFDYILWWRPNRTGYTYDILQAGVYDAKEAETICGIRGMEQAWPTQFVSEGVEHAVTIEKLNRLGLEASFKPEKRSKLPRKKYPKFYHCGSNLCMAWKDLAEARKELASAHERGIRISEALERRIKALEALVYGEG